MFRRVLIANRGEIACRIQRTLRRLEVESVAVYSDADRDALHVHHADASVRIGPAPVKESYLQSNAIIEAALSTGAQAIHPGYGLLSENEGFAQAVIDAGLVFIGPTPSALHAFGDKIRARAVARSVGVAPPPGTEGPLLPNDTHYVQEAERIGFPILVKAAGGGGGIGMQIVEDPAKLSRAVQACSDRGKSAFADERVYLERYVRSPRHIEVQVLCDQHGNGVALGERECSLQRRHQKIAEESPSAASFFHGSAGAARRAKLFADALAIVKKVAYVGAGTVEFVASPTGEIFFLEVNARLQVEHCVTEMVTGIDLVEQQLRIAASESLAPSVLHAHTRGASVEARIYAEDPAKKFAPQPGRINKLQWPDISVDLRIETGVAEGSEITPHYDPMIAKVVSFGETRASAIARLLTALRGTQIEVQGAAGPARTNLPFLIDILASQGFADANYDTLFAEAFAKAWTAKEAL